MAKKGKARRFGRNVSDTAKNEKEKSGSNYNYLNTFGVPIFKENKGRVELDVIPYTVTDKKHPDYKKDDEESAVKGELWWRRPFSIHRNIGPDKLTKICPKSIGKHCSICDEKDRQFQDNIPSDEVRGKSSYRSVYFVIPRNNRKYEEIPHVWDMSQHTFGNTLNDDLIEKPEKATFPNLEGGLTLSIRFEEKKLGNNNYLNASRIDFEPRKKDLKEKILKGLPSLDDMLLVESDKELKELFYQGYDSEDTSQYTDSDTDDDLPFDTDDDSSKKKDKKKKKKKDKKKKKK